MKDSILGSSSCVIDSVFSDMYAILKYLSTVCHKVLK